MKKHSLVTLLILVFSFSCFAQNGKTGTIKIKKTGKDSLKQEKGKVYPYASLTEAQRPEYPGGSKAMEIFIAKNIKISHQLATGSGGVCSMTFIINEDGTISDINVIHSLKYCPDCNSESVRVVGIMPKWKPGKIAGINVRTLYELPIGFGTGAP